MGTDDRVQQDRRPGDAEVVPLEVYLGSRRVRRFFVGWVALLVVYLVTTLVWGAWWNQVTAALLVGGQSLILVLNHNRLVIDDDGITYDERWRQRSVRWDELRTVRLDWWPRDGKARFEAERVDGTTLPLGPAANLTNGRRDDERAQLLTVLRARSAEHGFALEGYEPPTGPVRARDD